MTTDPNPQPNPSDAPAATRKRFTMPMVVAGLLGGHMLFIFTAITLGTGDPSFAVVPDYYQKAVDYDDRKADLAASEALGWRAELKPGATLSAVGDREVVVVLRDREGAPVADAELALRCYHYARAGEELSLELTQVLPGQYAGRARVGKAGFWQFDLSATRGDERFIAEFKQFVPEVGAEAEASR